MVRTWMKSLPLLLATLAVPAPGSPPPPQGITLVGKGAISGTALDKSGLTGNICQAGAPANCIPRALLGGLGSALAYTGHDNVFIATPDRGPFDGLTDVNYLDRFHFLYLETDLKASFPNVRVVLLDTRFLENERRQTLVGATSAFVVNDELATLRFDPEGVRVGAFGTFYVSDEYGPYLFEFHKSGKLLRRLPVPGRYRIANPSADANTELTGNLAGRQANRGMEGLAISPDGRTLFGLMQNALLQDNGLSPGTLNRLGLNNRILRMDIASGETREHVYVIDAINRGQGANELLAINDHEFLVLERDNRSNLQTPPQAPTRKTIYKVDLKGATDVSGMDSLPAGALPPGVTPVSKSLFIDLLDPAFGLVPTIPEKIEGLAWGPDLPDGRHLLYVISDNDLIPELATQIYAFAIDPQLSDYQPQRFSGPLYPPGQVRKALGR